MLTRTLLAAASAARFRTVRCSSSLNAPTIVNGLSSIVDNYDAILLDQFGVLHDGKKPLPGAVDCYEKLAASGKRLVVLSNTSRRRAFAVSKLPVIGFDDKALLGFVTSGEAAHAHIAEHHQGERMLWISWDDNFHAWDPTYLNGLDVTLADAATCDFVLLQGSQCLRDGASVADAGIFQSGELNAATLAALRTCAERNIEVICANPDLYVTLPDGTRGYMPGCIANEYEALGGRIKYFGKPHLPAFEAALKLLGPDVDPSRVLHCGDSLMHDIAGANAAGIHSLFVAGGIHAEALGIPDAGAPPASAEQQPSGAELTPEALSRLFDELDIRPTLSVASFVW